MTFKQALKIIPLCIGGIDWGYHKTTEDLKYAAQHELDLYYEGNECDIGSAADLKAVQDFIRKCG